MEWNMLMSSSAVHDHSYIHVTFSHWVWRGVAYAWVLCTLDIYRYIQFVVRVAYAWVWCTHYIYRYIQFVVVTRTAIKSSCTLGNTFANTDINGFRSPDRHCCPQIEEHLVGVICGTRGGTLPRLPMNVYIHKNYTAALSSSCLFIWKWESCELWATRSTASPLISFCHSRWTWLLMKCGTRFLIK